MASKNVEYYEKLKQLQEKQHNSELQRLKLEQELNVTGTTQKMMSKLTSVRLQNYWNKVCEDEKRSRLRNEQLLREFDNLEMKARDIEEKIAELSTVKAAQEFYMTELCPNWQGGRTSDQRRTVPQNKPVVNVTEADSSDPSATAVKQRDVPISPFSDGHLVENGHYQDSASFISQYVDNRPNIRPVTTVDVEDYLEPSAVAVSRSDSLTGRPSTSAGHWEQGRQDSDTVLKKVDYDDDGVYMNASEMRLPFERNRLPLGLSDDGEYLEPVETRSDLTSKGNSRDQQQALHDADSLSRNLDNADDNIYTTVDDVSSSTAAAAAGQVQVTTSIADSQPVVRSQSDTVNRRASGAAENLAALEVYDIIPEDGIQDAGRHNGTDKSSHLVQQFTAANSRSNVAASSDRQLAKDMSPTQGDEASKSGSSVVRVPTQSSPVSSVNGSSSARKHDGLTLDGFCHLLDSVESEIKCLGAGSAVKCYTEDESLLPAAVYREIIELSNRGRVLSAVSLPRLCAVVLKDLPQLCSTLPVGCLLSDRALDNLSRLSAVSQLTEHDVREQANEGGRAVWDRLFAHLSWLTSRGAMSADELADIFAPLLVSYNSQCVDQARRVLSVLLKNVHIRVESPASTSDFSLVSSPRKPQIAEPKPPPQDINITAEMTAENGDRDENGDNGGDDKDIEIDEEDDDLSVTSVPPTQTLHADNTLRQSAAYQQLLSTTGSSFNLTTLTASEVDSDDEMENKALPRRPGPLSSSQPAAGTDSAPRRSSRELTKQPSAPSLAASGGPLSSGKNTDTRQSKTGPQTTGSLGSLRASRDNIVFKVDDDPDLDGEGIVIPTANLSGSGARTASQTAGGDDDDADDDDFDDF